MTLNVIPLSSRSIAVALGVVALIGASTVGNPAQASNSGSGGAESVLVARGSAVSSLPHVRAKKKAKPLKGFRNIRGCPRVAPKGTMRDGSEVIGVRKMCVRAARDARTPVAARAIVYAFNHLGGKYSQSARTHVGWFDCTVLIDKAYLTAGVQSFFTLFPYTGNYADKSLWKGTLKEAKGHHAGDIRIMWAKKTTLAKSMGNKGHGEMFLTDGYVIQSGGGGTSKVNVSRGDNWGWHERFFRYSGPNVHQPRPAPVL